MEENQAIKVYLSVPMSTKSDEQIEYALEMGKNYYLYHYPYHKDRVEFISNYTKGVERFSGNRYADNILDITRLGEGLLKLAECDIALFAPCGSVDYHCQIEHQACTYYSHKKIMEMTDEWRKR